MSHTLLELFSHLEVDQWREDNGFSEELIRAQDLIFSEGSTDDSISQVLNTWVKDFQPCIFGQAAATLGLLSYCIITEEDMERGDSFVLDKIQVKRKQWTADALGGEKSGFVILLASERLSRSVPNLTTLAIAKRLGSLYLLREIEPDEIYLDELRLDIPGRSDVAFRWDVGVNYFSAQGDKRWWHDHRIPGGIAFSMNSVGHLVKSSDLSNLMREVEKRMDISEGWKRGSIDTLPKALVFAMNTIERAANTISGKATELMPIETMDTEKDRPACPIEVSKKHPSYNYCTYQGFYHTDQTLPNVYFHPDVERPANAKSFALDFTYLFDDRLDNFDYINMGVGRQVQTDTMSENEKLGIEHRALKRNKAKESVEYKELESS